MRGAGVARAPRADDRHQGTAQRLDHGHAGAVGGCADQRPGWGHRGRAGAAARVRPAEAGAAAGRADGELRGRRGAAAAGAAAGHGAARPAALVQRRRELAARLAGQRVLDPELVEHADDRPPEVVAAVGVALPRDRGGQPVQAALEIAPVPRRGRGSQVLVVFQAQSRGQPLGGERAGHAGQHRQRLVALAAAGQHARERDGRVGTAGLELQRAAEVLLGPGLDQRVGLGRQQRVEEALDVGGRLRAHELRHDPAVLERLDGRDALDAEGSGHARVGVRVDLGQRDLALAGGDRLLEHGGQHPAGAAPGGPEVDDDGQLARSRDDVALEGLVCGVEDHVSESRLRAMDFTAEGDGVTLAGDDAGEGTPVVLLHGLTATRRYVVMGSRALERDGHRVVAYDARGHGRSSPAPEPGGYTYELLAADLLAVLDDRDIDRALLAGASMGAHTLLRFALDHGDRVSGLVVVTPAFEPDGDDEEARLERWDRLSAGLRDGGVEGFVEAYGEPKVPEQGRETGFKGLRHRLWPQ